MKKTALKVLYLATFLNGYFSSAYANDDILQVNNQATAKGEYHATQVNHSFPTLNSQYQKGHQLGLDLAVTKTFFNRLYTQVSLNAMSGNFSYGKDTPTSAATNTLEQVNIRMGYTFFLKDVVGMTPYLTTGYQYWQMDTGGKPFRNMNIDGDTRFYQNGFYGLGLLTQWSVVPRLVLNADAMLAKTFNPWMRYNAPDVPNPVLGPNVTYQQASLGAQPYYQVGVGVDYRVTSKLHANAGVQYSHSEYTSAHTNPSNIAVPHLSIADWNYSAGIGYSFEPSTSDTQYDDAVVADAIVRANNQAILAYGYLFQNYSETIPGQDYYFDREQGNIPFINIAINKTFERIFSQLSMSLGAGNTAYKGGLISGGAFNTTTRNTIFDAALKLGFMFFPNEHWGVTPYVVGGFHRWLRDSEGVPTNGLLLYGYPETYQNAWYGIGLFTQYTPIKKWIINIDGNAGTTQHAQNSSWNSFYSPRTYQQTFSLKQRFIFNIGVGVDYNFAKYWHMLAQYNYSYFKYGLSATSRIGIFEPNSTTHEPSLMAGVGYELI